MLHIKKLYDLYLQMSSKLLWLPPLLARITLGIVFIESGWGKLHNLEKVIGFFTELGIPAPQLQAPFVAGMELVCGALLLVGLFSRLAALPIIPMMLVAIVTARKEDFHELSDLFGFIEFLYIALAAYIAVQGAGAVSLDRVMGKKK